MTKSGAARMWVLDRLGGSEKDVIHSFTWNSLSADGISVQEIREATRDLVDSGVIGAGSAVIDTDNAGYILRLIPLWKTETARAWIMQKCYDQYMTNSQLYMEFTAVPANEPEPPLAVTIRESHALESVGYVTILGEARDVIHVRLETKGRFFWEEQLSRQRAEPRGPVGFDQEAA